MMEVVRFIDNFLVLFNFF